MRVRAHLGKAVFSQNEFVATLKTKISLALDLILDLSKAILDHLVRLAFSTKLGPLYWLYLAFDFVSLLESLNSNNVLAFLVCISAQTIHKVGAFTCPNIIVL